MNLNNIVKHAGKTLSEHSPKILTGLGVAGLISTVVLAVKATPDALEKLEIERRIRADWGRRNDRAYTTDLTMWETVKLTWIVYIPAVSVGAVTIVCIIGANTVSARRQAALIGAYSVVETSFREYKEKVIEQHGANKEQKVVDSIAQDRIFANPESSTQVIITGNGDVLCYDTFSGRYFQSSVETLRKAANDINGQCFHEMYASQNDFYRKIGLAPTDSGESVGWNMDTPLELQFSTVLSEDGKPCLSVGYYKSPVANFHKLW